MTHTTIISYIDQNQRVDDISWTRREVGKGDGDALLETDEKFEITVDISQLTDRLVAAAEFTMEIRPAQGTTMILERTMPAVIDKVNDLN